MGRKTAVLLKGFRAAKCLTLLKVATARIKVVRNKRSTSAKQMRGEIAQLIKSGQDAQVYITKADALIKQENLVAVYDVLDQFCHAIMGRFPVIELQRICPADMKEPIASIIYAAPKCIELTELAAVKDAFVAKYGKEFAAAATELRPDCGVNTQVVELLSVRPATGEKKLKLMKEICKEYNVNWAPGEALTGSAAMAPLGVGVGEAGSSSTEASQSTSKHGASNKVGLAQAFMPSEAGNEVCSATNVLKTSEPKKSILPEEDATKFRPTASASMASSMEDSSKSNVSKVDDTQLSTFEEEDARKLHARIMQSLKGGSFIDSEADAELNTHEYADILDAQAGIGDSDSDSFVSVEDVRLEDDGDISPHGGTSRKGMVQMDSNQNLTEAYAGCPGVNKLEDMDPGISNKNSNGATELGKDMLGDSDLSSLDSEHPPDEMLLKLNNEKILNAEEDSGEEGRNNNLTMGKLAEAQIDERIEDKTITDKNGEIFPRMSSEKNSTERQGMEKKSGQDGLDMTKFVEAQSVEEINEEKSINEKSAETIFVEMNDLGDQQREDYLEGESTEGQQTKSSLEKQLSKGSSLRTRKTVGLIDDSYLNNAEIFQVMPSVAIKETAVIQEHVKDYPYDANKVSLLAEEESRLPASEISLDQSSFEKSFEKASSAAGEESLLPNSQNAHETGEEMSESLSVEGISVVELLGAVSSGALAMLKNSQGFATSQEFDSAAAKAIADEAARKAILDYAKRIAETKSASLNVAELPIVGVALDEGEIAQAKQTLIRKGLSEYEKVHLAADTITPGTNVVKGKKTPLNAADDHEHDLLDAKVMNASNENKDSKPVLAEHTLNLDEAHKDELLEATETAAENDNKEFQPAIVDDAGDLKASTGTKINLESELENINPFAMNATFDIVQNGSSSALKFDDMVQPRQTSQAADLGQDDHLDIFFRRKMFLTSEENLVFDEGKYDYAKPKSSFVQGKIPHVSSDGKNTSLHENLISKPLFETSAEGQNAVFKDYPDSSEHPLFDEGDGGSFKSPIFDEVPEPNDTARLFDVGFNRVSGRMSDIEHHSAWDSVMSSGRFDPEPEPIFHGLTDEKESTIEQQTEFPLKGELKWVSKIPVCSSEDEVTSRVNSSLTSKDVSGKPLSVRSRKQPKVYVDDEYNIDNVDRHTRIGHKIEPGREGADDVWPHVSKSSALNHQPSGSSERVPTQAEYGFPSGVGWDHHTRQKTSSIGNTLPSTGLINKGKLRSEEFYFPDENDLPSSSTSSSTRRISDKSPYRHLMEHSSFGMKDDVVEKDDYKKSYNFAGIPKSYQHNMVEEETSRLSGKSFSRHPTEQGSFGMMDDVIEEEGYEKSYNAPRILKSHQHIMVEDEMGRKINKSPSKHLMEHGSIGMEDDILETDFYKKKYNVPRLPKTYQHGMVEDDDNEVFGQKNMHAFQGGEVSKPTTGVHGFDSTQQQYHRQQEPVMGSKYKNYAKDAGESSSTRPVSSRQQHKKYTEEDGLYLSSSRYKPMEKTGDLEYGSIQGSNKTKQYELEKDVDDDTEHMGINLEQYRVEKGNSKRNEPMPSGPQQMLTKEHHQLPGYTTNIQDTAILDLETHSKPKIFRFQSAELDSQEGYAAEATVQTQRTDSGRMVYPNSGFDRRHQRKQDASGSDYVHHEDGTAQGDRMPTRWVFNAQKALDSQEIQDVAPRYKESENGVRSSPSRPPSIYHEKQVAEDRYTGLSSKMPIAPEGGLQISPQLKQGRLTQFDNNIVDLQFGQRKEQRQQSNQQVITGSKWELREDAEKQLYSSPSHKSEREKKKNYTVYHEPDELRKEKQRFTSTPSLEDKEEQVEQLSNLSMSRERREQDSRPQDNSFKSDWKDSSEGVAGTSAAEDGRSRKEGIDEKQGKVWTEYEASQSNGVDEVGASVIQQKSGTKSQLLTQQESQSTDLPLEIPISDPVVLVTIPPPVKKPSFPRLSTTKVESSVLDPPHHQPLEEKVPNQPKKPPTLQDLAANFEALRRARKGE